MRSFFFLVVFVSFLNPISYSVWADVTVDLSVDVELALGAPTGEDEIQRMVNEGLRNMGRTNPGALALLNSGQTIKIICYGSDKAKELKIEKPEMSFIPSWGETVGAFNADGTPTSGGTAYIVLDCDRLRTGRWYTEFTYLGATQSMWDILVHELLHATHQERRHPPDTLDLYQNWVTAFNQSIATLLRDTRTTDAERGYFRLPEEWMEQFRAALVEELRKNQQGAGSGSSSPPEGSGTSPNQPGSGSSSTQPGSGSTPNQEGSGSSPNQQGRRTTTPQNNQNQGASQNGGSAAVNLDAYIQFALGEGPDPTADPPVAIGLSYTSYETPRFFNGFSADVPFTPTDMLPPPVEPVKDTKVSFGIGSRYAIQKHLSVGFTYEWEAKGGGDVSTVDDAVLENYLGGLKYKFAIGAGYDAAILEIPWTTLLGKQRVEVGVVVNNHENNIVYFTPTANTWQIGERFTEQSGIPIEWNTLSYDSQVQGDLQVAPQIRTDLLWVDPTKVVGVGPNPGMNIAPAPGLDPKGWPHTEGQPIPSLTIEVKR